MSGTQHPLKNLKIIVACQYNDGIASEGTIPWHSKMDLQFFKQTTTAVSLDRQNAIIMGRKTFDTLRKPLSGRINYVISRSTTAETAHPDAHYFGNLEHALQHASNNPLVESIFIIGGETIYNQIFESYLDHISHIYITWVNTSYNCDKFFHFGRQSISKEFKQIFSETKVDESSTPPIRLEFTTLVHKNVEEQAYLDLARQILEKGEHRSNRTIEPTRSMFGVRLEFDISTRIPILTTKRVAWKTALRELLWFISGSTDNEKLRAQKVRIWDGNSSREYLDSVGLVDRREGDLGPVYGFQWRHFGADYTNCDADYNGKGVDQLSYVIHLLKNDPTSRRIMMSAWNPPDLPKSALPPCHVLAQWYVRDGNILDCQLYQRSGDYALGVPFNIASYSMLTAMLASVCGMRPGKFIHIIGDAHIYENHVEGVKTQLERVPYIFPKLKLNPRESIDDFVVEDFELVDYSHHGTIKMDMAV